MEPSERALPAVIGRYEILRRLGTGAMGQVLLARDPVLDRSVAVKLLRDDLTLEPEQRLALVERMRQEARASARVSHPNIVALFDMGQDPELGLYLVFEYAEGVTLKQKLLRGPLAATAAATLARDVGDALSTAHEAGVLHRDIKPENVILTPTGGKIADFGIARVPNSTLTRDGSLLGTPAYSAPECITRGAFSPLSDQFSMAATFYEAISQRRAFPGEDAVAVATRIQTDETPPIARSLGLSPHVDEVLERGLAKAPEDRFQSTRDFGRALAEALELLPRNTMPTMPDQQHQLLRQAERGQSRTSRLFLGGAALGALFGAGALQLSSGLRPAPAPVMAASEESATAPATAVGWLLPAPRPKPKPQPSAAAHPPSDPEAELGAAAAPSADAGADPAMDAGAPAAGAGGAPETPDLGLGIMP